MEIEVGIFPFYLKLFLIMTKVEAPLIYLVW